MDDLQSLARALSHKALLAGGLIQTSAVGRVGRQRVPSQSPFSGRSDSDRVVDIAKGAQTEVTKPF